MESGENTVMPDLHSASVSSEDFFKNSIDYTRPLNEYPTIQKIVEFLRLGIAPQHIYTETLNVKGKVVCDKMENYLENDAISSSMLKSARKTPLDFHFSKSEDKEELEKIKGKDYFNIGTFLHQCLLEPTKFSRAIEEPKYSLSGYEGANVAIEFYKGVCKQKGINYPVDVTDSLQSKKTYLSLLQEMADIQPVNEEHKLKIDILKRHSETYGGGIIRKLLTHAKREISIYYTDPETGIDLKVRPDALQFEENIGVNAIVSIKSTACENLQAFMTQAAKLDYDLSEGMYQEVVSAATGRDFNTTIMIMLQTVAPFHIGVLVWTAEDIEMGKHKYKHALHNAALISENDSVKGYEVYAEENSFGLIQFSLPGWNQREQLPQNI